VTEGGTSQVRTATSRKLADEWALVLTSQRLHATITQVSAGFGVSVPEHEYERAVRVLAAYDRENRATGSPSEPIPPPDFVTSAVLCLAFLGFFAVTGPRDPDVAWFARGSADAARILAGETWRIATALTLHADLGHAIGNAAAGLFFIGFVCGALGFGLGAALVVAAGALGNLANAHFHAAGHSSLGASTAVFGALGILASLGVVRHWRRGTRGRRALAPIAAGLGLLAMLGTGDRSDVSGHLFGIAAGALLGLPVARFVRTAPRGGIQWLLAGTTLVILLSCWATALQGVGPIAAGPAP